MKLVQSTWFKNYDRIQGNWPDEKFALFSISLSHHFLKKQGLPMRLNTNSAGFDIVVDRLGLEYAEVDLCLEADRIDANVRPLFDRYWSLNKLYAYSLMKEPFIHFDNDVYFLKKLDQSWEKAALVAQNLETNLPYYTTCLTQIQQHFNYVPTYLNVEPESALAVNAGIAGGAHFGFFQQLYGEVIEFLTSNAKHLDLLTDGFDNIFIEQCMFKSLANHLDLSFQYVLKDTIGPSKKYRVNQFHQLPQGADYIHVMNYKSNPTICESIAKMLYYADKKLYHHCIHVAKSLRAMKQPTHRQQSDNTDSDVPGKLKYFFQRTTRVCRSLTDLTLNFESIEKLSEAILLMEGRLTKSSFLIVQDVFAFEFERYQFFTTLDPDYTASKYRDFVGFQSAIRQKNWKAGRLCWSESAKLVESRWNWVECNEFLEVETNHYLTNLKLNPGYFATLIYYYPEQNTPKEHPIDLIDTLVIKLARKGIAVNDLVVSVLDLLKEQNNAVLGEEFLLDRVRFFAFHGVLVISNE